MALCSGLAPLVSNHFGRRALLRGRLHLHAINATALIEETVSDKDRPLRSGGVAGFMVRFAGRLNTPARTNSRQLSPRLICRCISNSKAISSVGCGTTLGERFARRAPDR